MAKIISLLSRKGGAGKSTTAQALTSGFTSKGYRVLAVDLDGQASLTHIMAADYGGRTIFDVMRGACSIRDAVQHTGAGDIISANNSLDDVEINGDGRELLLKQTLEPVAADYDLVLLDTVAAFDIMTLNALSASTGVILPAQCDILSLNALKDSYDLIQSARENVNAGLKIYGVLLTRVISRSKTAARIAEMFKEAAAAMNTRVFNSKIRESATVRTAQALQRDILTYRPQGNAAKDYQSFINELEIIFKMESD